MQDKVLVLRTCFNSYLGADKAHRASDRPTKRSSQHPEPGVRSVPSLGTQHPESGVYSVPGLSTQRPESGVYSVPSLGTQHLESGVYSVPGLGTQHLESGVYSVPSLGTQHPESGVLISNFSFILPVFVCCSRLSTDNHKRFLIAPAAVDDWLSDFIISAYFAGDKSAYSAKS